MDARHEAEVRGLLGETLAVDPRRRAGAVRALGGALTAGPAGDAATDEPLREAGWDRVLELVDDPDPSVRRTVLHALVAEAPTGRAPEVDRALRRLSEDGDDGLARRARKLHARFRRDLAA